MELACELCEAKYSLSKRCLFDGIGRFQAHLSHFHHKNVKAEEVLDSCTTRVVSLNDANRMMSTPAQRPVDIRVVKKCGRDWNDSENEHGNGKPFAATIVDRSVDLGGSTRVASGNYHDDSPSLANGGASGLTSERSAAQHF